MVQLIGVLSQQGCHKKLYTCTWFPKDEAYWIWSAPDFSSCTTIKYVKYVDIYWMDCQDIL